MNVQGAMQAMTSVVEDWVREYPEQWLWMHRRWRVPSKIERDVQGNVSSHGAALGV